MEKLIKFIKYWLPVILWAGLTFYLSSRPGLKSGLDWPYDFILRKGAHIFEFAVLFLLLIRAFGGGLGQPSFAPQSGASEGPLSFQKPEKALFWAFLLTLFYSVFDEAHQLYVLDRVGALSDVLIDNFGVLLIIFYRLRRFH